VSKLPRFWSLPTISSDTSPAVAAVVRSAVAVVPVVPDSPCSSRSNEWRRGLSPEIADLDCDLRVAMRRGYETEPKCYHWP